LIPFCYLAMCDVNKWVLFSIVCPVFIALPLYWGNNGCGYLPFSEWNRVLEDWVGVSRRTKVEKDEGHGSARRTSAAGSAVPSTEVPAVETVRPWYIQVAVEWWEIPMSSFSGFPPG